MDVLSTIWHHLGQAAMLWWDALRLHPDVAEVLAPGTSWVPVIMIAALAGLATLIGQSVVLFVNQVRRWALVFSLVVGILAVLGVHLLEGLMLWGLGRLVFAEPWTALEITKVVILSSAPLAFEFLTAIPLLGPGLSRLLSIWSMIVLWAVIAATYPAGPWAAAAMVLAAWLGMLLLGNMLGPILAGVRDRIWRRVTGRALHPDTGFLLELVADPKEGAA